LEYLIDHVTSLTYHVTYVNGRRHVVNLSRHVACFQGNIAITYTFIYD